MRQKLKEFAVSFSASFAVSLAVGIAFQAPSWIRLNESLKESKIMRAERKATREAFRQEYRIANGFDYKGTESEQIDIEKTRKMLANL